jgi:class 3 adenylate cyclase
MAEVSAPPDPPIDDLPTAGRKALAGHRWSDAYELFQRADAQGQLGGDDLEAFAEAAFFTARAAEGIEIKERAFKVRQAEGDEVRAAYLALDLAREYAFSGQSSIASGWLRRAERMLGDGGDTYAHGFLALARSDAARSAGHIDRALALAERAVELGEQAANADLRAYGLTQLGQLKIAGGETEAGFALMEEASLAAVNGELSPMASGVTACQLISACRDLTDYRRASEWIEATERYCRREAVSGFPGVCRIHRAEVKAMKGAWEQAEHDLQEATIDLDRYNAGPILGDGYYAIGDIRRLKGDFAGAHEALREAHARGHNPQPALALVLLAEGNARAAATAINATVADETYDRWLRARLLPAQAEIAVAVGDLERARLATRELAEIVATHPSPALEATRRVAQARILLLDRDPEGAAAELRAAIRGWRDVGAPYEIARARQLLSRALRMIGNDVDADLELQTAHDEFVRLGAAVDASAAEVEQREVDARRAGPAHVRRTFMFTDIVGSTTLAETLGDEAWERLLRWHDDTLTSLIAASGGQIVNPTGDGFFVAFEDARRGLDAAKAIQRALRDHAAGSDFSLGVRIGLHTSEANQRGADFSGVGVHVAARVAALAEGGTILATKDALTEAGDDASGARPVDVRGVSAPVPVAEVDWST